MKMLLSNKSINLIFTVAFCILIFNSIIIYQQIQHLLYANSWVIRTHQVIEHVNNELISVIENNRQESAYFITHDASHLQKQREATEIAQTTLDQINALTKDDPIEKQKIANLIPLVEQYIHTSQDVIDAYQKNPSEPIKLTRIDQPYIDKIKSVIDDIDKNEFTILDARNSDALRDAHQINLLVLAFGFISTTLLLLSFLLLNHHLNEHRRIERHKKDIESQMNGIIEGTTDLIAALDLDMKFIAFNRAYERRFNTTFNSKIKLGMNLKVALGNHVNQYEHIIKSWQRALDGDIFTVTQEMGDDAFYETTFSILYDSQQKRIGASHIMRDITQRRNEETKLIVANEKLSVGLTDLESRYQQIALLNEMSEALQSCLTAAEAYHPIKIYCQQILPYRSGILYILNPSRNYLEMVTSWGNIHLKEHLFSPEQCWALRSNLIHKVDNTDNGILCSHLQHKDNHALPYICTPLMAHNETFGLLYLDDPIVNTVNNDATIQNEHNRLLLITVEEQISLALANIKLRETLRHLSIRDPLTGLYNRRYLEETLEREFHRAERKKTPLAIIMIDIDHFKRFNDTHGHDAGDEVLKAIGKLFQKVARGSDIVCRYGGEEFLLFLYDTDRKSAQVYAERLRQEVRNLNLHFNNTRLGTITISQGIAIFPDDSTQPHSLIEIADHALYKAKKAGRDRIVLASDQLA